MFKQGYQRRQKEIVELKNVETPVKQSPKIIKEFMTPEEIYSEFKSIKRASTAKERGSELKDLEPKEFIKRLKKMKKEAEDQKAQK